MAFNAGGSGNQKQFSGLGYKRKLPASAAAQPAKRKHSSPATLRPSDGPKAASNAKPARQGSQSASAVQQEKVLKWAKQLTPAAAPRAAGPKQSLAEPGWDSLKADDILARLQGAAEEFEATRAGFSMSLEYVSQHVHYMHGYIECIGYFLSRSKCESQSAWATSM